METPTPPADYLKEILHLTRENNEMLHAQRRNAYLLGIIKFLVYLVLFAAPIWFYMTYVSGTLDTLVNDLNEIQGTKVQTQQKFQGFENAINDFKSRLPSFLQGQGTTSSTSSQ